MTRQAALERATAGPDIGFTLTIVAVATIGGFMFGYDSGVINGTQEALESAFGLSKFGTGINVGAILIGCAAGAFAAARLADRIGRRGAMLIAAVLFLVSALAAGAATSSLVFVAARFVGGLGVGAASILSPIYISEVTPAHIRGRVSSLQQIMIITGLTGAFLANYKLAGFAGSASAPFWLGYPAWRWMFWMQAMPAALYFLALLRIPESPRFLVLKGRDEDARAVLARLLGSAEAGAKVADIRRSLAADHHQPRFADLRDPATGRLRPIVWAGIGLASFQQLVGINIVFYYGSVLWRAVGVSETDSLLRNVAVGVVSIAACALTVLTVERVGRKPLLLFGSAGMAVALGAMAVCFHLGTTDAAGQLHLPGITGPVAFWSAIAYAALFNVSWGPVMWVLLGEMFPNQIRGPGLAISGLAQWLTNFAVVASFPPLLSTVGLPLMYGFYAASALVSFFFVRALVGETTGRELEDMRA